MVNFFLVPLRTVYPIPTVPKELDFATHRHVTRRAMHFLFYGRRSWMQFVRGRIFFIAANFMVRKPIPTRLPKQTREGDTRIRQSSRRRATKIVGRSREAQ